MIRVVRPEDLFLKRQSEQGTSKQKQAVQQIIREVQAKKDQALYELTERFDGASLDSLLVEPAEVEQAYKEVDQVFIENLKEAAERIRRYHEHQKQNSWMVTEDDGSILGQLVRPLERVGVYVPGGRAAYPSTVLMNIIPAQVAGVKEIVMTTPPQEDGSLYAPTVVAASVLGIEKIFKVGGAQAIAALAYGTETIPAVDKIVGPGNIYVALAKQTVYGQVAIDSIAGPSEVVVIADDAATPAYVAADLLAQAEHDPMASAILITPSKELADQVAYELNQQLEQLKRKEIAQASIKNYGAICLTKDLNEAFDVANRLAPEHLELLIEEPWNGLAKVKHAGAVFLGEYSPEAIGDYFAGPNHVLPTNGTARFFSALGVDSFVKKTSVIAYSQEACLRDGPKVIDLAEMEGLEAHAKSIQVRLGVKDDDGSTKWLSTKNG